MIQIAREGTDAVDGILKGKHYLIVPPKYSDGPAMIGLDRLPSIPILVATSAFNVRGGCLDVQNIRAAAAGERRTPTTTHRAATFSSETAEADDR